MFFEGLVCLLGKHGVAINDVNVNKTGEVKIDIDFSEHDKPFKVKIRELEESYQKNAREIHTLENDNLFFKQRITEIENKRNRMYEINKILRKNCNNFYKENKELKQSIAELESKETETCENEPKISDSAPSREWYENRHQSDCIEINRLNTTIDVLIHKVEYLRQFAGLE